MRTTSAQEPRSIFEKPWFLGIMLVIVLGLGVALWYISTHQQQVSRWISGEQTPAVQKPTVKPTPQPPK